MLTDQKVILVGPLLFSLFLLYRFQQVKQVWQAFGNLPTHSVLVSPISTLGRILPHIPWISSGIDFSWENVYERVFAASHSDLIHLRSLYPSRVPQLLVADATASKTVFQGRVAFPKVVLDQKATQQALYGPNISIAEYDEWRGHRRIAGPSFSESNNALVWESTVEIILGYFIKWNRDGKGSTVRVSDFTEVTKQVALMVFSTAGFGINGDKNEIPKGHTMPFMQALATAIQGMTLIFMLPRWLLSFMKWKLEGVRGHDELEKYMLEMIEERKSSAVLEERRDLLSNLIRASLDSQKGFEFTHRDLLGNVFVFMLAGHETTASVLSFATALLAIHQEEQEELYKHVRSVVPDGRLPTYYDVPRLTRVLAVINETLRLFSPATMVMKRAAEDCVIQTDSGGTLPVPKGTIVVPMVNAMHHNPKYWPEPYKFRPDRFLGDYNKDAFIPFSTGARGCIGRRFSEIEQIAALSIIVLHYKVTILDEPQYAHETAEERKMRVLAAQLRTVVQPVRTPVVFTPREGANILAY